jgi:hypothetical protein
MALNPITSAWNHGDLNKHVFEWKRSWPNLRYYSGICLEVLRRPIMNASQDSLCPDQSRIGHLPHRNQCYRLKQFTHFETQEKFYIYKQWIVWICKLVKNAMCHEIISANSSEWEASNRKKPRLTPLPEESTLKFVTEFLSMMHLEPCVHGSALDHTPHYTAHRTARIPVVETDLTGVHRSLWLARAELPETQNR